MGVEWRVDERWILAKIEIWREVGNSHPHFVRWWVEVVTKFECFSEKASYIAASEVKVLHWSCRSRVINWSRPFRCHECLPEGRKKVWIPPSSRFHGTYTLWRFGGFQNESSSTILKRFKNKIKLFKPKWVTYMPQVYLQQLSILLPILLQLQLSASTSSSAPNLSCGVFFGFLNLSTIVLG